MRIDHINIKNYRCFADVSLELDPRLTVIVARNGKGKSALLDALKVALWPFVAGFDLGSTTNDVTGIHVDDVRREMVRAHEMNWRLPSSISAFGNIQIISLLHELSDNGSPPSYDDMAWAVSRYRDSIKKSTGTKTPIIINPWGLAACAELLQERIFSGNPVPDDLPMLGYYGTGRLWNQKKLMAPAGKADSETLSRTFAYRDCLDPSSSYKHFVLWYTRAFKALRDAQIRSLEKGRPFDAAVSADLLDPIRAVQQAVDCILSTHTGWQALEYSAEHDELILHHEQHGTLKVSQLSDGIRNMLALAGDIAYRCYKLNAHHGARAAQRTHGIVLIDEVDMHLHPAWQQTVLPDLARAFPCIQFIVTTHSAQVLTSIDAECIRSLDDEFDEKTGHNQTVVKHVSQQTLGVASSETLADVMGIDPIPDVEPARQLSQYRALIQQNLHDGVEGQQLRQKLEAHFGAQHPLILDCDRLIRFQEFKRKLPERGRADA